MFLVLLYSPKPKRFLTTGYTYNTSIVTHCSGSHWPQRPTQGKGEQGQGKGEEGQGEQEGIVQAHQPQAHDEIQGKAPRRSWFGEHGTHEPICQPLHLWGLRFETFATGSLAKHEPVKPWKTFLYPGRWTGCCGWSVAFQEMLLYQKGQARLSWGPTASCLGTSWVVRPRLGMPQRNGLGIVHDWEFPEPWWLNLK